MRSLIFSTAFAWNISHSKKHSAKYYHECTWVFMYCTWYSCHILMKLKFTWIYRVIQNDCRGVNNLSYTMQLVLQMQPHVISFYGVTSRIRFMFLLFPQVFRNWRYESEPPLKPSPLTCYKQFGTNSIIVLMFVESQGVHIYSTCKVCNKHLECCSIK